MTSPAPTASWTDAFQAIGTVGAALIAALGLLVTVWIAIRDRRDFQERLEAQRQETSESIRREALQWESRENRRFQSSIVLEIGREYAVWMSLGEPVTGIPLDRLRILAAVLEPGACSLLKWQIGALSASDTAALTQSESAALADAKRSGGASAEAIKQEFANFLRELGARSEDELADR